MDMPLNLTPHEIQICFNRPDFNCLWTKVCRTLVFAIFVLSGLLVIYGPMREIFR